MSKPRRVPREATTPALDAALRAFVGDGVWSRLPKRDPDPARPDRAREILLAGFRRFADAIVLWIFGVLLSVQGGLFHLLEHSDDEARAELWKNVLEPGEKIPQSGTSAPYWFMGAGVVLLILAAWATYRAVTRRPQGVCPAVELLAAALPRLDLSPPERLHAETLVRAYERDDAFLKAEVLPALRTLCAEWGRLDAIEAGLAGAGPREGEIETLRAKLARTEDPVAREALGQSLATAERHAAVSLSTRAARERLDAHRETIVQSAHALTETAAHSRGGDLGSASDLTDLRASVARATGDVAALEAAVQEMRTL